MTAITDGLFSPELSQPSPAQEETIQARFEAFDRDNPQIYLLFRRFAQELLRAGRRRYGAKSLFERIRWHYATTTSGDEFKLNNNFTGRYARKLIEECPEFADFFETRELRSK